MRVSGRLAKTGSNGFGKSCRSTNVTKNLAARSVNGRPPILPPGDSFLKNLPRFLEAVRGGDFSVRLPGDRTGLSGKIADTFNEIVAANQRMAQATRTCRPGRRARRQDPPARQVRPVERRLGRDGELGQHADRRSVVADHGGDPRDHRGGARRPPADRAARRRRPAAAGRIPALGDDRQHDDRAARRLHLRSDARRARGRHRRQARRPGAGPRGDRRVARPDRERQLDGEQPDRRRSATSPRSRSRSPTATCRRKSPSTCAAKSCS